MRAQLEPDDLQAIASKVAEILAPMIKPTKAQGGEELLTVEDLAAMLKTDVSWVYKQVQLKTVPYIKIGKYTRFKRSEILKHLETCQCPAASQARIPKART